jgi:hypothetical protein
MTAPRPAARDLLATAVLALLLWDVTRPIFYDYPPPWPDEALFGSPAQSFLDEGVLATRVLAGSLPGAGSRTYWIPPLYPVWIAGWFAALGASLWTMRIASFAAAVAVLFLTLRLGRRFAATGGRQAIGTWQLAALAVAIDPLFVRGSIAGRMDALTLALSIAALLPLTVEAVRARHLVVSGVLCALAVMCHPMGAAAPAAIALSLAARPRDLLIFAAALAAGVLPWVWYIAQAPALFAEQFGLQLRRKAGRTAADRWQLFLIFLGPPGPIQWLRLAAFALGGAALGLAAWTRRSIAPVFFVTVLLAALAIWSGEEFYPLYIVPFAAIGIASLHARGVWMRRAAVGALAALVVHGAVRNAWTIAKLRARDPIAFAAAVDRDAIRRLPPGSIVMSLSNPDPAAVLMFERREIEWREFSPVLVDPSSVHQWLEKVDAFVLGDVPRGPEYEWILVHRAAWPAIAIDAGGIAVRVLVRPGLIPSA